MVKNNKKDLKWVILGVVSATITVGLLILLQKFNRPLEKFSLEIELYDEGVTKEITTEEFETLVTEKKSFLVMAHMTYCPANMPLTDTTERLAREKNIVIYTLTADSFKKTSLAEKIKYLPSMAVFHRGELVDFLDAESDEDLPYYQSVGGLESWVEQYVDLK